MSTITLKPGLLVSLHTRMEGGVRYTRVDLDADKAAEGESVERWETTKVVEDPAEHETATKVRGKCGSIIRSVCTHSAFGLLCAADKENALDEAIREARERADLFNASAKTVHISVYVLKGRIAESDQEAARAISSELQELMTELKLGVDSANVERIREAASKAKKIGAMLDADAGRKVSEAVEEARAVAREMVKKLVAGEEVADYLKTVKLTAIDEARGAFLDLDEAKPIEALPETPRGLDFSAEGV